MDFSIMVYAVIALVGVVVGWLFTSYQHTQQKAEQLVEHEGMVAELSAAEQQITQSEYRRAEYELLNNEVHNLQSINTSLEADLREATARMGATQQHTDDRIHQMINGEQHLNEQFENLANRIFEHSNRRVDEQSRQGLNSLLSPLREQLNGFRRQVQDSFGRGAQERHTLTHKIRNLQQLNAQMAQEAINLTHALKSDNKTQGSWGEVILTRVLEASGLREGYEYEAQVSIENDARSRIQPDVIVWLSQGKDVMIGTKMTLVAYERYFNVEDDHTRESVLQKHITSMCNRTRLLGRKDYQQLPGLRALDYMLMFVPVEPAFLLALGRQPELITEALKNNIMLVSSTTPLVALRTIANLQRYEHRGRNAQQIADRTSKLYDKMRLFVGDMSAIGQSLGKTQDNYRQTVKELSSGRGDVLAQAEASRGLGVEIKREINPDLAGQAVSQDEEYRLRSVSEQSNGETYRRDDEYNQQSRQPIRGS